MIGEPYVPDVITVHLGAPSSEAENVTITFPEYIKNVASSEIFPTWPENALRANVYAQISFALNRVYTEFYRNQGYDFDITNSTAYDQSFVNGRDIFQNISDIVDEIFNDYIRRQGSIEPFFAQYCNGTTVTCDGLSQWGTVELAEQGMTPYDILTYYYGDDIDIVTNAPVGTNVPSFPNTLLRRGDSGNEVLLKQIQLNRISRNYPAIPKIYPVDGIFGQETEDAVRAFQRIFGLTEDGIIGKATWYRIAYLYVGVKRLSELDSEGIALDEFPQQFPEDLSIGATGVPVRVLQYYLSVVALFYDTVPQPGEIDGIFGERTQTSVRAFQTTYGLEANGVVDLITWQELNRAYRGIVEDTPQLEGGVALFPGEILRLGSQGENVRQLQIYLNRIAESYPSIPTVSPTGVFGNQTQAAVIAFQTQFGLQPNGIVSAPTWDLAAGLYSDLTVGSDKQAGQYPGYVLEESV